MKVYECENSSCLLGSRKQPGLFTGGASKELITTLTGDPEPEHHGEGVCPSCGEKAKKSHTAPDPAKGKDPYQHLHEKATADLGREWGKLQARVYDPDDEMTEEEARAGYRALADKAEMKFAALVEQEEEGDDDE